MANEIAKLGISPDGTTFEEKFLGAASVVATDGTSVQTHMANTAIHQAVPTKTSQLTNDSGFLTGSSALSAAKLSGVIPIANMPPAAIERLATVANDTARFALTTATVQLGDTVKVEATGKMYFVKDDTKLASADGYEEYTAGTASSVPWGGITDKPTSLGPTAALTTATQAEAEAGSGTTVRAWTPQRVMQAANKAAQAAANSAVGAAPKDMVFVTSEAAIATSGVRPGGFVLMQV